MGWGFYIRWSVMGVIEEGGDEGRPLPGKTIPVRMQIVCKSACLIVSKGILAFLWRQPFFDIDYYFLGIIPG